MAVFHLPFGSRNIYLHAPLSQAPVRSMQHVWVTYNIKKHLATAFSYDAIIVISLLCCHLPWTPWAVAPFDTLCTPLRSRGWSQLQCYVNDESIAKSI